MMTEDILFEKSPWLSRFPEEKASVLAFLAAFFTLAFPALIELHQDAIRVAEKHCANVPMSIAKRIGWPTGLGAVGEQALRHFVNVRDRKGHVADADLI
jgi:hypothetical protein